MKQYTLKVNRKNRDKLVTGSLPYLIDYFGYTLKVGHSYNPKVNIAPKTIDSLISNLDRSNNEIENGSFDRTTISKLEPKE